MRLPDAFGNGAEWRRQLERADDANVKRGLDIEMGLANSDGRAPRIILTSPNGTRYALGVDNAGNLTTTSI